MRKLMIHVSCYRWDNPEMSAILQRAQGMVSSHPNLSRALFEASKICEPISLPGFRDLDSRLAYIRQIDAAGADVADFRWHWMFGLFEKPESSISVEAAVQESLIPNVKLSIVEFGENFGQSNVHITECLQGCSQDEIPGLLKEGETWEQAWMFNTHEAMDVFELANAARELGLEYFSAKSLGMQILVYSIGNRSGGPPSEPEGLQEFRRYLQKKVPSTEEFTWDMRLSNFGSADYGATHSYQQARELLSSQLSETPDIGEPISRAVASRLRQSCERATNRQILAASRNLQAQLSEDMADRSIRDTLTRADLLTVCETAGHRTLQLSELGRKFLMGSHVEKDIRKVLSALEPITDNSG